MKTVTKSMMTFTNILVAVTIIVLQQLLISRGLTL